MAQRTSSERECEGPAARAENCGKTTPLAASRETADKLVTASLRSMGRQSASSALSKSDIAKQSRSEDTEDLTSSEYKRRLFATRPRVRYGHNEIKFADLDAPSSALQADELQHGASSGSSEKWPSAITSVGARTLQVQRSTVQFHGFQEVLSLPSTSQYKSQLLLLTAETFNNLRLGRFDENSGVAEAMLRSCANGKENCAWRLYGKQQLTPLGVCAWIYKNLKECPHKLLFTYGALAGQSWSLQQLQSLPKSRYGEIFNIVCMTYHANLQSWYKEMNNSSSPVQARQLEQKLTTLVVEHRALCFAITFLNFTAASKHHMWPELPATWAPTSSDWCFLMDKVALKVEQLQLCSLLRKQAKRELVHLEMCTALIKSEVETKLEGPDLAFDDVNLLDSVEALSSAHAQRSAMQASVANEFLFEILTPQQAAIIVAAFQVDIARRPVYHFLDWIRLLSNAIFAQESHWIDCYTCK